VLPGIAGAGKWNSRLEQSVISDYHRWLAPLLLLWPRLSWKPGADWNPGLREAALAGPDTAAAARPAMDPERIQAALVAARMEEALSDADPAPGRALCNRDK
jgi:hypothetical protein